MGGAGAGVGCYLLKLAGLSVPARVLARPRVARAATLLPVALLSGLVAVQVLAAPSGAGLVADARLAGLGAAIALLVHARRSSWWCSVRPPSRPDCAHWAGDLAPSGPRGVAREVGDAGQDDPQPHAPARRGRGPRVLEAARELERDEAVDEGSDGSHRVHLSCVVQPVRAQRGAQEVGVATARGQREQGGLVVLGAGGDDPGGGVAARMSVGPLTVGLGQGPHRLVAGATRDGLRDPVGRFVERSGEQTSPKVARTVEWA